MTTFETERRVGAGDGRSTIDALLGLPRISADNHVTPPNSLWQEALPDEMQQWLWREVQDPEMGRLLYKPWGAGFLPYSMDRFHAIYLGDEASAHPDFGQREFRNEPSGGTDIDVRIREQSRDGVVGEVIYPNALLGATAHPNRDFQIAVARAYNDFLVDTFGSRPDRFHPVAILPIIDIDASIAEARRARDRGLRSVQLPMSTPWRPYSRPDYEPLWHALEELDMPLNFHTFTGNLAQLADFADVRVIPQELIDLGRADVAHEHWDESLNLSVIGTAAGMGPIVHLVGAGVLERHPRLRFAVVETEGGWLAWLLWSMDNLQHRRRLALPALELLPSEYFHRQGKVTFSDDPVAMHNLNFTGDDCLMWANDYPHDEGTFPHSNDVIARTLGGIPLHTARKLLHDNAANFYQLG